MPIDVSLVGRGEVIGVGAFGTVYRTSYQVPGLSRPMVYKEFNEATLTASEFQAEGRNFTSAAAFRDSLSDAERAELDEFAAWPVDTVVNGDKVVGGILPLAPDAFFVTVGAAGFRTEQIPAQLSLLPAKTGILGKKGLSPDKIKELADRTTRVALLAHFTWAISWLHDHGIVYGDVSLKNALFSLDPPRILLVDCDASASASDPARHQYSTPFYGAPEFEDVGNNPYARGNQFLQDTRSDVYKLALSIVRGLSRGPGATNVTTVTHLVGRVDPPVLDAIERALSQDPDARPTAAEVYVPFYEYLLRITAPPDIREFRAISTTIPRGSDLAFECRLDNATAAHLVHPNGATTAVDPECKQVVVKAETSGVYTLRAERRGAVVSLGSEHIHVFDMPPFDLGRTTTLSGIIPPLSDLPAVEVNSILRAVPARPTVDLGANFVPDIPSPSTEHVVNAVVHRAGRGLVALEVVNAAIDAYKPHGVTRAATLSQVSFAVTNSGERTGSILESALATLTATLHREIESSIPGAVRRTNDVVERAAQNL